MEILEFHGLFDKSLEMILYFLRKRLVNMSNVAIRKNSRSNSRCYSKFIQNSSKKAKEPREFIPRIKYYTNNNKNK